MKGGFEIVYKLDHIVHFVEKPEKLVNQMNAYGVHTVAGGRHEIWGSYNSLSYFDDLSYIEFIGIYDEKLFTQAAKNPFTLFETYEKRNRENGFTRIALRTNKIEEDAKRLRDVGLTVFGPDSFSRKRPDGSTVSWKLLHFGLEGQEIDFPFLIEWDDEDQERVDELVKNGTVRNHSLGNLKIKEVIFSVSSLEIAKRWSKLFNFEVESSDTFLKIKTPNCNLLFTPNSDNQNIIKEVLISGANEEKIVEIENANYKFIL